MHLFTDILSTPCTTYRILEKCTFMAATKPDAISHCLMDVLQNTLQSCTIFALTLSWMDPCCAAVCRRRCEIPENDLVNCSWWCLKARNMSITLLLPQENATAPTTSLCQVGIEHPQKSPHSIFFANTIGVGFLILFSPLFLLGWRPCVKWHTNVILDTDVVARQWQHAASLQSLFMPRDCFSLCP